MNRVYIHEMGEVRCGGCLIAARPAHQTLAEAIREWTPLNLEQAQTLETDMAETLVADRAFASWGMQSVEASLLDVAAANYCERCGKRLQGLEVGTVSREG